MPFNLLQNIVYNIKKVDCRSVGHLLKFLHFTTNMNTSDTKKITYCGHDWQVYIIDNIFVCQSQDSRKYSRQGPSVWKAHAIGIHDPPTILYDQLITYLEMMFEQASTFFPRSEIVKLNRYNPTNVPGTTNHIFSAKRGSWKCRLDVDNGFYCSQYNGTIFYRIPTGDWCFIDRTSRSYFEVKHKMDLLNLLEDVYLGVIRMGPGNLSECSNYAKHKLYINSGGPVRRNVPNSDVNDVSESSEAQSVCSAKNDRTMVLSTSDRTGEIETLSGPSHSLGNTIVNKTETIQSAPENVSELSYYLPRANIVAPHVENQTTRFNEQVGKQLVGNIENETVSAQSVKVPPSAWKIKCKKSNNAIKNHNNNEVTSEESTERCDSLTLNDIREHFFVSQVEPDTCIDSSSSYSTAFSGSSDCLGMSTYSTALSEPSDALNMNQMLNNYFGELAGTNVIASLESFNQPGAAPSEKECSLSKEENEVRCDIHENYEKYTLKTNYKGHSSTPDIRNHSLDSSIPVGLNSNSNLVLVSESSSSTCTIKPEVYVNKTLEVKENEEADIGLKLSKESLQSHNSNKGVSKTKKKKKGKQAASEVPSEVGACGENNVKEFSSLVADEFSGLLNTPLELNIRMHSLDSSIPVGLNSRPSDVSESSKSTCTIKPEVYIKTTLEGKENGEADIGPQITKESLQPHNTDVSKTKKKKNKKRKKKRELAASELPSEVVTNAGGIKKGACGENDIKESLSLVTVEISETESEPSASQDKELPLTVELKCKNFLDCVLETADQYLKEPPIIVALYKDLVEGVVKPKDFSRKIFTRFKPEGIQLEDLEDYVESNYIQKSSFGSLTKTDKEISPSCEYSKLAPNQRFYENIFREFMLKLVVKDLQVNMTVNFRSTNRKDSAEITVQTSEDDHFVINCVAKEDRNTTEFFPNDPRLKYYLLSFIIPLSKIKHVTEFMNSTILPIEFSEEDFNVSDIGVFLFKLVCSMFQVIGRASIIVSVNSGESGADGFQTGARFSIDYPDGFVPNLGFSYVVEKCGQRKWTSTNYCKEDFISGQEQVIPLVNESCKTIKNPSVLILYKF